MWTKDFKIELFPLHSPLLRESLLVSFPPLNNMLKFSGSSHPSSDRITEKTKRRENYIGIDSLLADRRHRGFPQLHGVHRHSKRL